MFVRGLTEGSFVVYMMCVRQISKKEKKEEENAFPK